jgi:ech hydrogenase subunit D
MNRPDFLAEVLAYRLDGWRLSVINATAVLPSEDLENGAFDVSWSFAKDQKFEHLRHRILPGEEVPSVSASFGSAFLYENEMSELFGIAVTGMNLDLKGQLYHGAVVVPFSPKAIRARLEARQGAS